MLSEGPTARGDRCLDRDPRRLRADPLPGFLPGRRRDLEQYPGQGRGRKGREAPDHPADRPCLRHDAPPVGAVANALHALTLLIARQLVNELEDLGPDIEYFVVPPLCPLVGSPYDFSRTSDHIERAIESTDAWLAQSGLQEAAKSRTRCARTSH